MPDLRSLPALLLSGVLVCGLQASEQKTQLWEDGTKYVGEVVDGKRQGKGTIIWPDGTRFIGAFQNDMRNGPGTMILPDGTVLTGTFVDDELMPPSPEDSVEPVADNSSHPPEQVPVTELNDDVRRELMTVLGLWAAAWSEKNAPKYLAYYHEQFEVPDSLSRRQWEALRRARIRQPSRINVTLSFVALEIPSDNTALIEVEQTYTSNLYSDISTKLFKLTRTPTADWKILAEELVTQVR